MVKEIDKSNPKNLVEGATFALKIENDKKYKDQYFILIYTHIPYWTMFKNKVTFRVKITTNNKKPTIKEEIEKLEYIKLNTNTIEEEASYFNHAIIVKPDKYGYIYNYILQLYINRKRKLNTFEYIGNFKISRPKNEYISESDGGIGTSSSFENLEYKLLSSYENYNLKKAKKYTPEGNKQSRKNAIYNAWVTKTSREVFQKVEKEGRVREWLLSMGIDPDENPKEDEEDTLTYVGPPDEERKDFEEK